MVAEEESLGDYLQTCQPMYQIYGGEGEAEMQKLASACDSSFYCPQERPHVTFTVGEGERRSVRLSAKEAAGKRVHWEMDGAIRGGVDKGVDGGSLPGVRRVARAIV